jgi:transcriptional regulator with XRE-family HTH domain
MDRLDIKRIRTENKLTQVKLAELTGYPQGFISQMENGNESIPASFVAILAEKLNITDINAYMYNDDTDTDSRHKMQNSCYGKNAKWQSGSSDLTVQRLLDLIDKIDAKVDKKEAEILKLRQHISELEAQIRELKK